MTEVKDNVEENIKLNFDKLCQIIDIEKVRKALSRNKTLGSDNNSISSISVRDLFGKYEFRCYINYLLVSGNEEAARIIAPCYVMDLIDFSRTDPKNWYISRFSFGDENSKDLLIKPDKPRDPSKNRSDEYQMQSRPRGYCLLINNYYTIGSFKEMHRFRKIFFQLHFEVIMKRNLTVEQIYDLLCEYSTKPEQLEQDAFAMFIITHGNGRGEIYGFDGQPIHIQTLISLFNNNKCIGLRDKPKMFFFNCCREDDIPTTDSQSAEPMDYTITQMLPTINDRDVDKKRLFSDITICYSTIYGSKVDIDLDRGTEFGESLSKAFIEKASYRNLNQILQKAQRFNDHQMFEKQYIGDKHDIYFNP